MNNRKYRYLFAALFGILVYLMVSVIASAASTTYNADLYETLQYQQSIIPDRQTAPVNTDESGIAIINPASGGLEYESTDLYLKGKGDLDLEITRKLSTQYSYCTEDIYSIGRVVSINTQHTSTKYIYKYYVDGTSDYVYIYFDNEEQLLLAENGHGEIKVANDYRSKISPYISSADRDAASSGDYYNGVNGDLEEDIQKKGFIKNYDIPFGTAHTLKRDQNLKANTVDYMSTHANACSRADMRPYLDDLKYGWYYNTARLERIGTEVISSTYTICYTNYGQIILKDGTILPYENQYCHDTKHDTFRSNSAKIISDNDKISVSMYKLFLDYPRESMDLDEKQKLGFCYEMRLEDYTGRNMYFDDRGILVAETDRFGNKIIYDGNDIIDSYGRQIHIPSGSGSITVDGVPVLTYSFESKNNDTVDKNNYFTADDQNILTVTYPEGAQYTYTTTRHNNLYRLSRNPNTDSSEKAYKSNINCSLDVYTLDKIALPTGAYETFTYQKTNAYAQRKYHTYERMKITGRTTTSSTGAVSNRYTYAYGSNITEGLLYGGNNYIVTTTKNSSVIGQMTSVTDTYDCAGTLLSRNDSKNNDMRTFTEYEYVKMPEGNKKISKETVTNYAGSTSVEQITEYTYNANQQVLTKTIGDYKETYKYGEYGLMTQSDITKGVGDLVNRTVRNVYTIASKNISAKRTYDITNPGVNEKKTQTEYVTYQYNNSGDMTYDSSSKVTTAYQYLNTTDTTKNPNKNSLIVTTTLAPDGIVEDDTADRTEAITTTTVYDLMGNVVSQTDAKGNQTTYEYDGQNRLIKQTNPDGTYAATEYFDTDNQIIKTDENGNKIKLCYDSIGQYSAGQIYYPDNNRWVTVEWLTYDDIGNVKNLISQRNLYNLQSVSVDYTYYGDGTKKSETVTDSLTGEVLSKYILSGRIYTSSNNSNPLTAKVLTSTELYYSDATHYTRVKKDHDLFGNITQEIIDGSTAENTSFVSKSAKYSYDYLGNLLSAVDAKGNITSYTYNASGQLLTTTNANGDSASNTYDTKTALMTSSTDYNGNTTSYLYNCFRQVKQTNTPTGGITKTYYDANGNQAKVDVLREKNGTVEKYDITRYLYDSRNQLRAVIGKNGGNFIITQYAYDGVGNRTKAAAGLPYLCDVNSLTRDNCQLTEYKYNYLNQCIETIDPMGQSEIIKYDLFGNPLQKTDRNSDITTYHYTPLGQLKNVSAVKDGVATEISYTYDMLGNRKSMIDETGTTTYAYDGLSRLKRVTDGDGIAREYTYDNNDNVIRMSMQENDTEKFYDTYSYNALNLVTFAGNNEGSFTMAYDKNGNMTKYTYGKTETTYTYNADNSLASATAAGEKDTYSYYLNGNRKSVTNQKGVTTYVYDGLGRLEQENVSSGAKMQYKYDSYGNRTQKLVTGIDNPMQTSYTYDKNNRLTRETTEYDSNEQLINSYYYDNNGNQVYKNVEQYLNPERLDIRLQLKTEGTGTEYTYDGLNRLKEVKNSSTTAGYTYDGDNLRRTKTVNGETTRHVYNGQNVIYEEVNGTAKAAYHRLGDRILASRVYNRSVSNRYYYVYNGQGNITKILNGSSNTAVDYDYDAFGYKSATNEDVYNPFRYNGEYLDNETGYTYLRNRYYDSNNGRFINEDPIRSGLNWYSYCSGNPVMCVDPMGLASEESKTLLQVQYKIMEVVALKAQYSATWIMYQPDLASQSYEEACKQQLDSLNSQANDKRTEILSYLDNNLKDSASYNIIKKYMDQGMYASIQEVSALLCAIEYNRSNPDATTAKVQRAFDLAYKLNIIYYMNAPNVNAQQVIENYFYPYHPSPSTGYYEARPATNKIAKDVYPPNDQDVVGNPYDY